MTCRMNTHVLKENKRAKKKTARYNLLGVCFVLSVPDFIYYISAVVTQHIKSVALLQLVTFGYMFRPLPGHHQANKE